MYNGAAVKEEARMTDRQNTIVCAFDQRSPRITAYHIHEWINEKLRLEEDEISMIQIDGRSRRVFIKFTNGVRMHRLLQDTGIQTRYR